MIPDELAPEIPPSERYVYRRLKDELPESWVVIHGRRFLLPSEKRAFEGELDFLVIDRERGALGLEVKGGGVERAQDRWFTTDRQGTRHSIKDPSAQASAATHAIFSFLRNLRTFGRAGYTCPTGWGVVFPDIDIRGDLGPELPRKVIIDRSDFANLRRAIDRLFDVYKVTGPPLPPKALDAMLDGLLPTCNLIPSLAARLQHDQHSLIRLTDEQVAVLDMLDSNRRVAIEGSAGTGKTLIALEKARRLGAEGYRTLLLCFNRPLADSLRKSAVGFDVDTFHGFCSTIASRAKVPFRVPRGPTQKDFWSDEAPLILIEALESLPDARYDAIVVDEGQDFRENWWPAVDEVLHTGKRGILYVFFDPHQNLYGGGPPRDIDALPFKLVFNCRNTSHIAEFACEQVGIEVRVRPGAPIGSNVTEIHCDDDEGVAEAVRKLLHQLVAVEHIATDQIVVLSTRATKKSALARKRRLGNFELVDLDSRSGVTQVGFTTLQRFKGLESDVVILIDVEPGETTSSSQHLYVGTSRARHLLFVVAKSHSSSLHRL